MQSRSKNNIPIRLTDERWQHIVEGHPELTNNKQHVLAVISQPEQIFQGRDGELLAMKEIEPNKWLVVAYRELKNDGFVITAYSTRRIQSVIRRTQLWP